jgi:predicted nuclease of predicted toxin-antitoxin system
MKFLVDAQLPVSLVAILKKQGHDTIHTDDLPNKQSSTDVEIRTFADSEERIVITKDYDFLDSYYFQNSPGKLLLITTGNIKNQKLFELLELNLEQIVQLFNEYSFVELSNYDIIGHE